jgi:hypothetical protein
MKEEKMKNKKKRICKREHFLLTKENLKLEVDRKG